MDSPYYGFGPWVDGPDQQMREKRLKLEEELMIKLGAKKEVIEYHPLILSSRVERAKSFVGLQYNRATPPLAEKSFIGRNSWQCQDQALRQMTNPSRRGPRDIILPNLVKSPTGVKVNEVPEADFGFFTRREAILERLTQVLSEWTDYQKRAFPPVINSLSQRNKPSSATLTAKQAKGASSHKAKERRRRKSTWSWSGSSENSGDEQSTPKGKRRKKTRWDKMAQEVLLQMKASHMRLPIDMPKSELRIYVSSTPDLHEEREFLEEVAYPKLKELAEKLGLNCHFVDMRKGSGHLSNDIETFDLIEKELKNCKRLSIGPYFISLLGNQLDDEKLPGFLEKAVYEEIRETLIRDDIIGVEMFDEAYRLDSNRLPPVYIKQPLQAIDEYQGPEQVEQIILDALQKAVALIKERREGDPSNNVDFYKWSAVVREVECGLLRSHNPRRETLCFLFDGSIDASSPFTPDPENPVDRLRHRVQAHLHRYASKNSLMQFKTGKKTIAYLRSLADTFIAGVASLLKSQLRQEEYDVTQQLTEGSEALQHVRIALSESDHVAGNGLVLEQVRDILDKYNGSPMTIVVEGSSGMGKTTLVSQIARSTSIWQPRWKLIFRSLGHTLRSSSLFRVLESLIKQLAFIYSLGVSLPLHASLQDALETFCRVLKDVSENQKPSNGLLLIIDNLDKLPEMDSHCLFTILNALDVGIILILTSDSDFSLLPLLKSHETVKSVKLTSLNKLVINDFIQSNLSRYNRRVTTDQVKMVLKAVPLDSSPLYLQLVFHIIKWWPSHTLPEMTAFTGNAEIDFNVFVDNLEAHSGKAFTRYALSFLAMARHGLGDNELVHLLAEDPDLLNEIKEEQDECVSVVEGFSYQIHLSKLLSHLGKFVIEVKMEGETVFLLSSRALIACIKTRYLMDSFFYTIHKRLATFFLFIRRGLLLSSKDISEKNHQQVVKLQWRRLRCVPYHLCYSSDDTNEVWTLLKEKVFFNFSWIVNEVYSGFYNDFLNDIKYALENVSLDPHIQYLQTFLISIRQTVIHNPMSLAAIFSSQNIQESDVVKDSIRAIVQDAREWLRQIQTQALVPLNYTSDKINRLLIKRTNVRGVDDILSGGFSASLFLLKGHSLSVIQMVTGEEMALATLNDEVRRMYISEDGHVIALTKRESHELVVHVVSALKGKIVKKVSLGKSELIWFDFRSMDEAYFATGEGIKSLNLNRGQIKTIMSMKTPWVGSHVSLANGQVVTAFEEENLKIDVLSLKQGDFKRFSFKKQNLNQQCNPILSTKDGKYIVVIFKREAIVLDAMRLEELESLSLNGLPIIHAILSRSHEHVFLAYANGAFTCHVLYTGNESMATKFVPKVPPSPPKMRGRTSRPPSELASPIDRSSPRIDSASPSTGRRSTKAKSRVRSSEIETVTTMVTSEDDHFLFFGTNRGVVYGIHVPTGLQIVAISTHYKPVTKLVFLTNQENFQHLITLNEDGKPFHWNLRPLLKQTRILLHDFIIDEDLLKEEVPKRELGEYYPIYNAHRYDRVFLNGPDIAAFYKDPPSDIFVTLEELDPAFKSVRDWEETGTIADCSDNIKVFVSGNRLGDILLTISRDQRLARWSLHDGSLVWTRKLTFGSGQIQDAALVYYDQALLVTERTSSTEKGLRISVTYIGENQTKVMTRNHVVGYWASSDRCQILIMCRNPLDGEELSMCHWDLINSREEICSYQETIGEDRIAKENILFTTFSPDLTQMVRLSLFVKDGDESKMMSRPGSAHTVHTTLKPTRATFPSLDREDSSAAGHISPLGWKMRRPGSATPDQIGPTTQRDADDAKAIDLDPKQVSGEKDNDSKTDAAHFAITTLLTWNKLQLRNREYVLDAQRRSLTSSRLSMSERKDTTSPVKQNNVLDVPVSNENTKNTDETTTNGVKDKDNIVVKDTVETAFAKMEIYLKDVDDLDQEAHVDVKQDDGENDSCQRANLFLQIELSAICFVNEDIIFIGTNSSHVMLLNIPSFKAASVLTFDEPRLVPVEDDGIALNGIDSPHRGAVNFVGSSEDGSKLVSADAKVICLWNTDDRTLAMTVFIEDGREITHMAISKDAAIVVVATSDRVIHVWTSIDIPRRIASYLANFDIRDLQMSCDCRKVIIGGQGQEGEFLLEIFEVKNIDDVLMHAPIRKRSQEEERTDENRENNKTTRRGSRRLSTRRLSTRRRSSVQVPN